MSPIEISWLVMAAMLILVSAAFVVAVKNLKSKIRTTETMARFYRNSNELFGINLKHSWHQLEMIPCNDGKLRSRQYHKEAVL